MTTIAETIKIVTWARQEYNLLAMSLEELEELLDWVIQAGSDQTDRAATWTVAQWAMRRAAHEKFLESVSEVKGAIEAEITVRQAPQPGPYCADCDSNWCSCRYPKNPDAGPKPTPAQPLPSKEADPITYVLMKFGDEFLAALINELGQKGYEFTDFATAKGTKKESSRISHGWQLALDGRVVLPSGAYRPMLVDSEPGQPGNRKYAVWANGTAVGHQGNQCPCQDHSYRAAGGYCKHVLAAKFAWMAFRKLQELAQAEGKKVAVA